MKIAILLPYKENYSPEYPGAVSLFVNSTIKLSKFKKDITVYGSTDYKKKLSNNYININLKKKFLTSQSKDYVKKFFELHQNNSPDIIEIHNRPLYVNKLIELRSKIVLYFHNDPVSMIDQNSERTIIFTQCLFKNYI